MRYFILSFLMLGLISCASDPFEISKDIDLEKFKSDRGGCLNHRSGSIDDLKAIKDEILTHSENEVLATFGRYDFQILDKKNQKVFVYYLEEGPHCEAIQNESSATTMAIYFNAVSLAKEVTFQIGIP
ncbi:hypothetical protein [Jiulongibacter sp. NS-SX5]|uniref:hypothetical protein n=1 Tax=Jiulongibacter sp. NS-SX5 TaxID=3463854 RepID=UPI004058592E